MLICNWIADHLESLNAVKLVIYSCMFCFVGLSLDAKLKVIEF